MFFSASPSDLFVVVIHLFCVFRLLLAVNSFRRTDLKRVSHCNTYILVALHPPSPYFTHWFEFATREKHVIARKEEKNAKYTTQGATKKLKLRAKRKQNVYCDDPFPLGFYSSSVVERLSSGIKPQLVSPTRSRC